MNIKAPSEEKIISHWIGDISQPLVSVCTSSFNIDKYINEMFDSILNQKTNFPFEILIHDDASTDKTVKIIKEYHKHYPKIIKPYFRKKNIFHTKERHKITTDNFLRAKGEFIAMLDGDDYWIGECKLQDQLKLLSDYPNIGITFSAAITIGSKIEAPHKKGDIKGNHGKNIKIFSLKEVIENGGGFMQSSSLFFRKKYIIPLHSVFSLCPAVDIYLQVLASKNGALYDPVIRCCYRNDNINSFTKVIIKSEKETLNFYMNNYKSRKKLIKDIGYKKSFKKTQSLSLSIYFATSKSSIIKKLFILLITLDLIDLNDFFKRAIKSKTFKRFKSFLKNN